MAKQPTAIYKITNPTSMSPTTKKTTPKPAPARRSNPPHNSYKHIALVFVVLAIILILGVTYLALSKVTITLTPSDEMVSHNFVLTLADNPNNNTSTTVILPAKILIDNSDVSQKFSVPDGQTIDAQAQGTVTIYNERGTAQTLVATTRLLTPDNTLFRLKDKVVIPANSSIQAKIYAEEKGAQGNIPPTTFTIPGLSQELQKLVYAKSTAPMAGGTRQIGILTASDIEKAELELKKSNSDDIIAKFSDQLADKNLALIASQINLEEVKHDQDLGAQVDSFNLSGKLSVMAVFADKDKIFEIAKAKLKESQGSKGEFINADPSSLKYELATIDSDKLEAKIKVEISGLTTLDPKRNIFDKNLLVGFTENDLKLYFSQFESIKDVKVEFSPFWVKKVPILKDHIIIKIAK